VTLNSSSAGESTTGEFGTWARRGAGLATGAVAVIGVSLLLASVVEVLLLMAIAVLLAIGLDPLIEWLHKRFGLKRGVVVLIVFVTFLAGTVVILTLTIPTLVGQIDQIQQQLPVLIANLRTWADSLPPGLPRDAVTQLAAGAQTIVSSPVAEADAEAIVTAGLTIAEALLAAMTVVALMFFWVTSHQRMERFLLALLAAERRAGVREAWDVVQQRLGYWVRGEVILMATVFLLTTVAYFVLGLPNALLLGFLAGLAELIPIVGPALGAVPALLAASLMPDPVASVLLVGAVYVAIQVFEGNVLVPIVMKNAVGVPPFLVVVSLIIGAAAGGLAGAILSVPLTAAVVVVLERIQAREVPVPLETAGPQPMAGESAVDDEAPDAPKPAATAPAGQASS
jgi:predicted PurR-regulated permease PerM